MSAESAIEWNQPPAEGFTADDLDRIPDLPPHAELIDGRLVLVSPPKVFHSLMLDLLTRSLRSAAPRPEFLVRRDMSVVLNRKQRPEPDVVVVRGDAEASLSVTCYPAEAVVLAVEVVSPESEIRDRVLKPQLYAEAGIPFFWRVEAVEGKPVVHAFERAPESAPTSRSGPSTTGSTCESRSRSTSTSARSNGCEFRLYADELDRMPGLPSHSQLIDGKLVVGRPRPRFHQKALRLLESGLCRRAPRDRFLVDREMSVVLGPRQRPEPDVIVVQADAEIDDDASWHPAEAVFLAVEVVSPESEIRDRKRKPQLYAEAGIRFFWRVENVEGKAVVHAYELDPALSAYTPLGIFHDRVQLSVPFVIDIDLTEIERM
ncbi:hypothetical protein Q0Z83_065550 [Actinoplanes sichuanensis]|uniref:Uma2 family endonuclease n=1 Tax=Actinoplanes sichuanensis TaxID=512349 RepID=A0ABW4ANY9_9ACTN|nr:Uma2 family endonuclease [Actinoplanes sichuanensis]BEL08364.1 hypothetical protein Q0Z83_065550 [Actinoplanes sichuanensis]